MQTVIAVNIHVCVYRKSDGDELQLMYICAHQRQSVQLTDAVVNAQQFGVCLIISLERLDLYRINMTYVCAHVTWTQMSFHLHMHICLGLNPYI